MQFHIENMTCGGCVRSVTKTIQSIDPEAQVTANLDTHDVEVKTSAPREKLAAALADVGYAPA